MGGIESTWPSNATVGFGDKKKASVIAVGSMVLKLCVLEVVAVVSGEAVVILLMPVRREVS